MTIKKITGILFVLILSAVFLIGAYSKPEPLEPFKFPLAKQLSIKSWWMVEILSRLIIVLKYS